MRMMLRFLGTRTMMSTHDQSLKWSSLPFTFLRTDYPDPVHQRKRISSGKELPVLSSVMK